MADLMELKRIAEAAAINVLPQDIVDVTISSAVGSDGEEILRVVVMLSDTVEALGGDRIVSTLLQVQDSIRVTGEERFPVISFATLKEQADDADAES